MSESLFTVAVRCLSTPIPDERLRRTKQALEAWHAGELSLDVSAAPAPHEPARPHRPRLVPPRQVPRRRLSSARGRAAFVHALAHIEFNAINLALDAVYRFRGLPRDYYGDWLQVAAEEAFHFRLLRDHLRTLGREYGDFPAHNGLWEMALKTAHDPLARMALVPRLLEARGLDASPAIIRKLEAAGDARAVEILRVIQRDEIGHVRIGNRWYAHLCAARGLEPLATFRRLLAEHDVTRLRAPFDRAARRAAGFSEPELALLDELAAPGQRGGAHGG